MDHSLGESQNYHRPIEQVLLKDYLNAVYIMTNFKLERIIQNLIEKSELEMLTTDVAELKK